MKLLTHVVLVAVTAAMASAVPAHAGTITATNNTPGIFDASSGTRTVTFTGAEAGFGSGVITDVNISINFAKADGQDFDPPYPSGTPFFNEIVFRLDSPLGTQVQLINAGSFNTGASGTFFDGTITFDSAAATVVNVNPFSPQAGTFRPIGDLGDFNGASALGVWTLFIQDTVGADALRFREFTLSVETAGVPEPMTLVLLGAGLVGAVVRRGRRRA